MATENVASIPQKSTVVLHETIIEGRIQEVDQPQGSEYTYYEFALPSKDEYSMPATVQVSQLSSQRPFGRVGDLIRIRCSIGGYPRRSGGRKYITNVISYIETL